MHFRGAHLRFRGSPLLGTCMSPLDSVLDQARQQPLGQLCCQKLGPTFRH